MQSGSITLVVAAFTLLVTGGCSSGERTPRPIGEAYVGPAVLSIRSDIPLDSSTVATVKHGDRLQILQRRRRFLRVRTPNGSIGWTDERQMLAAQDMEDLQQLAKMAAGLPSQGAASTFADLNVHTLPSRQAPSFLRLRETDRVDVLAHIVASRTDLPRRPLIPPVPKKAKAVKRPRQQPKYPPPPMPKAPSPPENWLALSKRNVEEIEEEEPAEESEPPKPVPTDSWSLVRTKTGPSGWVLTGRLYMAIPDEVAQYAEGKRIVSYFSLGEVLDGDQKKETWLWTTVSSRQPHDFDSFRVFIWNLRRHRYETAYIERNLEGFLPVLKREVEYPAGGGARYPGFSICTKKEDGQYRRRDYALLGNIIRLGGEGACRPMAEFQLTPSTPDAPQTPDAEDPGFLDKLKVQMKAWVENLGSGPK